MNSLTLHHTYLWNTAPEEEFGITSYVFKEDMPGALIGKKITRPGTFRHIARLMMNG